MTIKLSTDNLKFLAPLIQIPQYDRRRIGQSMVHIGVGGFHRAHQCVYAEDLFNQNRDLEWGFCGVGLLKHDSQMRDVLHSQDCLYTLLERSSDGDRARVVGSITDFLFAWDDREVVLQRMASEQTKIVSMTITEGGYYVHSGTGEFDAQHPDIQHDLAHPHEPSCSFGFLLEALERRRKRGQTPFTLMSCDNIQGNGDVLKKVLLAFAELRDPALANWMAQHCLFPNSMVDRITPATTDEHRQLIRDKLGIEDGWPVMTEQFKQWVIEDHFVQGRPAWETVGAQMTDNVLPYEKMKLRLLNASHQALCYIGMLLGYEFVHQTMEDEDIRTLVQLMMHREITPLLPLVPGIDLEDYKATLMERFANPAIWDQLSRIGIYGSSGMPKFVLPSVEEGLKRGVPITLLSFTVACWFRYLNGRDEQGNEIHMKDPMAPRLRQIAQAAGQDPMPLLASREIFSEELASSPEFVQQVRSFLASFYKRGARATLAEAIRR
ncbi:MAG TPA: mannitol dehydrogenase family protein [Abditibacteriaceae bacterium]|jgi:mannitol 2-dehydrogenase